MDNFNAQDAQNFQDRTIQRVREMERMLDEQVVNYYQGSRLEITEHAYKNFHGIHDYLKKAYRDLDQILTDIERRAEYQ